MSLMMDQIFNMINMGIVIFDRDLRVHSWNRWLEVQSGIPERYIKGASLVKIFPRLNTPKFMRSCKSIFALGNSCFFAQKRHNYLFPCPAPLSVQANFEFMQQNCTMGPLRDEKQRIAYGYITVEDVSELVAYEQRLIEANMLDGLTGVRNRKYLEQQLQAEFARHKRYRRPLSLIMMDIDFFKKINDTHGHQGGDLVLRRVAAELASMVRDTDTYARYGGEEFCCLLPETGADSAAILAERFRRRVEGMEIEYQGAEIRVTMSFGLAGAGGEIADREALLRRADEALYEAKRTGRNRLVMAEPQLRLVKSG